MGRERRLFSGMSALGYVSAISIMTGACADVTGDESVDHRVAALTAPELKGAVITNGHGMYNRCVRDVPAAFFSLPSSPSNSAAYASKAGQRLPPYNAMLQPFIPFQLVSQPSTFGFLGLDIPVPFTPSVPHVQSLTRFELGDQQDDRWFAVSRAFEGVDKAGFFLVYLPDMNGADGGPLLDAAVNYLSPVPPARATQYYYPIQGAPHPGGMQAFGHFLAVANEPRTGSSFVDIYDFSGGYGNGALIQRVMMFPEDFPVAPERSISGVAVTRLSDGRYLMFVLGKDTSRQGWFFLSRDAALPSTWDPFDYFDGRADVTSGSFEGSYQNATFLTECSTGDIYMLATGNPDFAAFTVGRNHADLFRLTPDPAIGVRMTLVSTRTFDTRTCTFRAAATGYAGKDGRLDLYCHSYPQNAITLGGGGIVTLTNNDPYLRFDEYKHEGCLYTELVCGPACCDQGDSCLAGACCAAKDVCGSICCGGANVCKDKSQSLCCDALSTQCGSVCCTLGQECVDGVCQTPPPPPPPPPGTCENGFPCSVPSDCPSHLVLCQGGCCDEHF